MTVTTTCETCRATWTAFTLDDADRALELHSCTRPTAAPIVGDLEPGSWSCLLCEDTGPDGAAGFTAHYQRRHHTAAGPT